MIKKDVKKHGEVKLMERDKYFFDAGYKSAMDHHRKNNVQIFFMESHPYQNDDAIGFADSNGDITFIGEYPVATKLYLHPPKDSTEPVSKDWISVEDRLPDANTDCIVWMPSRGSVMVCKYFKTWSLMLMPDSFPPPITHWMPLPAAPTTPKGGE